MFLNLNLPTGDAGNEFLDKFESLRNEYQVEFKTFETEPAFFEALIYQLTHMLNRAKSTRDFARASGDELTDKIQTHEIITLHGIMAWIQTHQKTSVIS